MKLFNNILSLTVAAAISMVAAGCATAPDVKAAKDLAARIVPKFAEQIEFVKAESTDSADYFKLSSDDNKIKIEANNAGSMAVGLNYYLKNYCLTEVSWYANEPIQVPKIMPIVEEPVCVKARLDRRFFLNYCTSGYSMPYWNWNDWERFIDWMALNGVNLPLATTGQEVIWYNVWSELGLTDEEIRSYFTGPAHLPWHRMCNLDRWQGGMPRQWLDDQADLQRRIIDRERELSMTPVLPAFGGHIPEALAAKNPDLQTTTVSQWGGFPDEYRCTYLSPTDSLFAIIQDKYLQEQTRLFGTDHIYGIDPFNEVDPPTWNPDSLAQISHDIYESLTAVDPEAIWLQMAWLLYADPQHWTPETAKAYVQGVPEGRMILLDYFCENTEEWKLFDSFYGQPYIWCYLGNFGGNSFVVAPVKEVKKRIDDAIANGGSNLCGIGSTLEGLDLNPFIYEYVLEQAWTMPETNVAEAIADRRIGHVSPAAREAWQMLVDSVLIKAAACGQGPLTNARPSLEGYSWWTVDPNISYPNTTLVKAWGRLLDATNNTDQYNDSTDQYNDTYVFDVVNLGRQALSNYFICLRDDFTAAYRASDVKRMEQVADQISELFADLTTLLCGHPQFSLSKWINDARSHGTTDEEKDYYERNARTLITIWGPAKNLNDYANRQYAELNYSYYAPRWQMFIDRVIDAAKNHKTFEYEEFYEASRAFENAWIEPSTNEITYFPAIDGKYVARNMYDKYAPLIEAHPASHQPTAVPSLHHW